MAELEALVASYQQDDTLNLAIQAEREKIKQEYDNLLNEQKIKLTDLEIENEHVKSELGISKRELDQITSEKEELHAQINSLKNKIKSLQAENDKFNVLKLSNPVEASLTNRTSKMSSPPLSHKSSECESEIPSVISARMFSFEDPAKERERIQALEEENKMLKEQNKRLNTTVET